MEQFWTWWLAPFALSADLLRSWFAPPAHTPAHAHAPESSGELPCDDHDLFA